MSIQELNERFPIDYQWSTGLYRTVGHSIVDLRLTIIFIMD